MGRLHGSCWTGLLAIAIVGIADPVFAATGICARLQTRLAALDGGAIAGGVENPGAYERSFQRQRDELDRATAQARRDGCLGGTLFQRLRANANCAATTASLNRMKADLNRLTADGSSLGDPFANDRARRELVRALAENRCDERERVTRSRGFFASLFGGSRQRGWGANRYSNDSRTYRTLCVRTCDGYYFPISFSTTRTRFAADEQTCQAQCPGTPVSLYIHRNPGQESDAMVSLTGEPYTALPTAFRYRRQYDAACTCGRITALSTPSTTGELAWPAATRGNDPWGFARGAQSLGVAIGLPPVPYSRPAAGEDPETLANRAGAFMPKPVSPPEAAPSEAAIASLDADAKKGIRTVGPSYLYGQ